MTERNSTNGNISGNITDEEIKNDQKANAELETRPNIVLTDALRTLRGGK